jgi:hypothetical protein
VRYFDLIERLLPADLLTQEVAGPEQIRHKLLSRNRAHGLLGAGGAGDTFARTADLPVRSGLHRTLVDRGALNPLMSKASEADASPLPMR